MNRYKVILASTSTKFEDELKKLGTDWCIVPNTFTVNANKNGQIMSYVCMMERCSDPA